MMGGGFSIIFWIVIIGVAYYFFKGYNKYNHNRHDDIDIQIQVIKAAISLIIEKKLIIK
ncbi:MAG: hypothetical protein ACOCQ2_01150 [Halanaerobiales bacterium]